MSRSNWRAIVAVIGCLAFGYGVLAGTWASQPNQHRERLTASQERYNAEAAVGNYAAYPIGEATACYEAPHHDSADLCAQWRAAIAAEKAAESARYANWLSIIGATLTVVGAGFVYATLVETKRSADAAHDANRPWVEIVVDEASLWVGSGANVSFQATLTNRGNSPATGVQIVSKLVAIPMFGIRPPNPIIPAIERKFAETPSEERWRKTIFPERDIIEERDEDLPQDQLVAAQREDTKQVRFLLAIAARYDLSDGRSGTTVMTYELVTPHPFYDSTPGVTYRILPSQIRLEDTSESYAV
jgi:hypothetical protein